MFEDFFFPHFIHHSVLPGVGAGGSPLFLLVTWTLVSAGDVFAFLCERYSFLRINSRMRCIFCYLFMILSVLVFLLTSWGLWVLAEQGAL